jgi:hypothetical protein
MELWSTTYLTSAVGADWATCGIGTTLWEELYTEHEGAQRLIAQIQIGQRTFYAAVGTPLLDVPRDTMYLPSWMLDCLGVDGMGDRAEVDWLSQEAFPAATHIVLRPHDSAFHHVNAKEELERALTRMGVLKKGTTILVPLEELGGYEVAFDVVGLEPADLVLAEGEEVSIEFEAALDAPPAPPPAVPAPSAPVGLPAQEEMNTMLSTLTTFAAAPPAAAAFQGEGQRLGGSAPPRPLVNGRPWNPWRDGPGPKVSSG